MFNKTTFNGNHTLTARAFNASGQQVTDSVSFTIGPVATANLRVNGSSNPPQIANGGTANVTWCGSPATTCANATSCSVTCTGGCSGWTGTSGTRSETLTASRTYTLVCQPGLATSIVSLSVAPPLTSYNLNVIRTGLGVVTSNPVGINCGVGANCQASYVESTTVTLTATPATNRIFTGWSGDCSGRGACSVLMNSSKTVYANFAVDPNYIEF